jgi:hypothetical protein
MKRLLPLTFLLWIAFLNMGAGCPRPSDCGTQERNLSIRIVMEKPDSLQNASIIVWDLEQKDTIDIQGNYDILLNGNLKYGWYSNANNLDDIDSVGVALSWNQYSHIDTIIFTEHPNTLFAISNYQRHCGGNSNITIQIDSSTFYKCFYSYTNSCE